MPKEHNPVAQPQLEAGEQKGASTDDLGQSPKSLKKKKSKSGLQYKKVAVSTTLTPSPAAPSSTATTSTTSSSSSSSMTTSISTTTPEQTGSKGTAAMGSTSSADILNPQSQLDPTSKPNEQDSDDDELSHEGTASGEAALQTLGPKAEEAKEEKLTECTLKSVDGTLTVRLWVSPFLNTDDWSVGTRRSSSTGRNYIALMLGKELNSSRVMIPIDDGTQKYKLEEAFLKADNAAVVTDACAMENKKLRVVVKLENDTALYPIIFDSIEKSKPSLQGKKTSEAEPGGPSFAEVWWKIKTFFNKKKIALVFALLAGAVFVPAGLLGALTLGSLVLPTLGVVLASVAVLAGLGALVKYLYMDDAKPAGGKVLGFLTLPQNATRLEKVKRFFERAWVFIKEAGAGVWAFVKNNLFRFSTAFVFALLAAAVLVPVFVPAALLGTLVAGSVALPILGVVLAGVAVLAGIVALVTDVLVPKYQEFKLKQSTEAESRSAQKPIPFKEKVAAFGQRCKEFFSDPDTYKRLGYGLLSLAVIVVVLAAAPIPVLSAFLLGIGAVTVGTVSLSVLGIAIFAAALLCAVGYAITSPASKVSGSGYQQLGDLGETAGSSTTKSCYESLCCVRRQSEKKETADPESATSAAPSTGGATATKQASQASWWKPNFNFNNPFASKSDKAKNVVVEPASRLDSVELV